MKVPEGSFFMITPDPDDISALRAQQVAIGGGSYPYSCANKGSSEVWLLNDFTEDMFGQCEVGGHSRVSAYGEFIGDKQGNEGQAVIIVRCDQPTPDDERPPRKKELRLTEQLARDILNRINQITDARKKMTRAEKAAEAAREKFYSA